MKTEINPIKPLIIYVLTFIFTLHLTPSIYINSSFLETFISEKYVGYMYTIASIVTVFGFFVIRPLLKRFGNQHIFLGVIILELISLLTLAWAPNATLVALAFVVSFMMSAIAFFNLDIFIEQISNDEETGSIRGIFLTSLNSAFILGPLLSTLLLSTEKYSYVYLAGAILLLPVLYIAIRYLHHFKDAEYAKPTFKKTSMEIWKNRDLHHIFSVAFILRIFFALMVIYSPIYLHQYIGFDLPTVTLIISISLIPFVLLEGILGKLADTRFGEKEILTLGLLIAGASTIAMSFINVANPFIWGGILFITRIGASMIEVMSETYLFKKVDSKDINIISIYRTVRPVAYIFAPIFASILLLHVELRFIFLIVGIVTLTGIRHSLSLKDTL